LITLSRVDDEFTKELSLMCHHSDVVVDDVEANGQPSVHVANVDVAHLSQVAK
jgi:hypothetical protein